MPEAHDPRTAEPPHSPEDDLLAEPPRWPKVVGIASIAWASLGMLCGACGVASPALQGLIPKEMTEKWGPMPAAMQQSPMQTAAAGIGIAWALVLLAAGIACVMRRPAARPMHLVYALGSIGLSLWGLSMGLRQMAALNQWAQQNPANEWAKMHNPLMGLVMIGAGMVLGLAWPGFCLVWFGAVKRRREDFTGGAAEPAA